MAGERTMGWDVLLFVIAVGVLILLAADELGLGAPTEASNIAQIIAPRLDVSEARLREELTAVFFDFQISRVVVKVAPLGLLTALLAVRLILDAQRVFRAGRRLIIIKPHRNKVRCRNLPAPQKVIGDGPAVHGHR